MAEFVAGRGTTAMGIIGTVLGSIGTAGVLGNGILPLNNGANASVCSDNMPVSRYELNQESKIAELQSKIALRDANTYNDQKLLEVYKYFDGQIKDIRAGQSDKWTEQAVINCQNSSGLKVLASQVADVTATVNSITKTAVPTSAICNFGCGCNGTTLV